MASTSDIRNGLCIEFNNDLYSVIEFQHVKPGKGAAFVRSKLKNLTWAQSSCAGFINEIRNNRIRKNNM